MSATRTHCFGRAFAAAITLTAAACMLHRATAESQASPIAIALPSGRIVTLVAEGDDPETLVAVTDPRSQRPAISAKLDRDDDVAPDSRILGAELVAQPGADALILTDSYPSRSGGLSYCQAGQERFLRVLAIAGDRLTQTLRLKLESCRENVELASEGLQWDAANAILSVRWLFAPHRDQQPETQNYRVSPSGGAVLITER